MYEEKKMRLREEIHSSLILSAADHCAKNHELIIIELLLDIRDQNDIIIKELREDNYRNRNVKLL